MRIFAWRLTGCVILLGCSLLLVIGCGKKETKQVKERIANVRVQPAETRALRPFVDAIGNLKAYDEVVVSSEVDGIIRNITVDEGSVMPRGAMLATVADTDYDLEVKRSDAAVKQAEASCENIKLEHQRKQALYKEELVTKQQFEDVATRLSLAESQCDSAKAGLALARAKLAKTKISSPLAGVVKEKKVSSGDYVKSGTPLFTIIHTDILKLDFTVTEQDAAKIKVGQDVVFQVDSAPGKEYRGRVDTIYPHLDEKTRTLMVEALIPNGDHSLKPGLFARVTLYTGSARETIVVAANAILYDESKTKIFVVEDNLAKGRDVKIGAKYGDMQEILTGVKDKETVVIVGQNNLAEGVKVNVAR
jgi:membrane fusion protein (multidrug efflux system)